MKRNNIKPDEIAQLFDKYDLRVIRILWFIIGYAAALISLTAILDYYDKI